MKTPDTTPSSQKNSWLSATHFSTLYEIRTSEKLPQKGKSSAYALLKAELLQIINAVRTKTPNFNPLIRFNEKKFSIEIGYSYKEFLDLIANSTTHVLPAITDEKFSNGIFTYELKNSAFKVVSISDHLTLKFLNNKRDTVVNYGHPLFWNTVENALKERGSAFKIQPPEHSTKKTLISDCAQLFQKENKPFRLIIGEDHNYPDARTMIREAIASDAIPAKTALILEGLFYEKHQKILDEWIARPKDAPFPSEFEAFFKKNPGMREIVQSAKEKGWRILAIGTEAISTISDPIKHIEAAHYMAKKIIQTEVGTGAFIALISARHAADLTIKMSNGAETQVLGLGNLLNSVGTVLVLDAPISTPIALNSCLIDSRDTSASQLILTADVILKADPISNASPFKIANNPFTPSEPPNGIPEKGGHNVIENNTSKDIVDKKTSNGGDLSSSSSPKTKGAIDLDDLNNPKGSSKKPQKLSHKNSAIGAGMLVFGSGKAINDFRNGDIFNGTASISETMIGTAGFTASFLVNNTAKLSNIVSKPGILPIVIKKINSGAGHFLKIVPFAGAVFSFISVGQDINDIYESKKTKNEREFIKASINLILDVSIAITSLMPGVGTITSLTLLTARATAGLLIDQACDQDAYQKTWTLLEDSNATWFDKAVAAIGGTLQLVFSLTPIGLLTFSIFNTCEEKEKKIQAALKKMKNLSPGDLKDLITATDVIEEGTRILDFSSLSSYYNGGALTFKIGPGGEKVNVQGAPGSGRWFTSGEIKAMETKAASLYVKMGQGAHFKYSYGSQGRCLSKTSIPVKIHAESHRDALTTYYHAPEDGTNVVFIAPQLSADDVLPTFKPHDFHHIIHGGKGTNTYKLGQQKATIFCGSGTNFIEVPFLKETDSKEKTHVLRTIILKNFRTDIQKDSPIDGLCFLTLKGMRVDFNLFQKAKIGLEKKTGFPKPSLFLKFGSTKIEIADFDTTTQKTLYIKTDDGNFEIDLQNLSKNYTIGTEKDLKDYISASMIGHMEYKYNDFSDKNLVFPQENTSDKITFSEYREDGIYSLYIPSLKTSDQIFKNAKLSFSMSDNSLNLIFGKTSINFKSKNIKYLSIITDDYISFVMVEDARQHNNASNNCDLWHCYSEDIHTYKNDITYFKLEKYISSSLSIRRYDNEFRGTPGNDNFVFDAKKNGKITIKDFSAEHDTLQIINTLEDNIKILESGKNTVINFEKNDRKGLSELTILNIKPSDLKKTMRLPALYGLSEVADEFMIDAKTIGHVAIKNFSVEDGDTLRIANTSETKENVLKKARQKDKNIVITFDQLNEITLENLQLSYLQQQNYDYLSLDVAA